MERKDGYYWVQQLIEDEEPFWEIAYYSVSNHSSEWYIPGDDTPYEDSDFVKIDETPVCKRYY